MRKLKVLAVGDIHGDFYALEVIVSHIKELEPDLLLQVGDFAGREAYKKAQMLFESVPVPILFVPGNNDPADLSSTEKIINVDIGEERYGKTYCHEGGICVAGIGGSMKVFHLIGEWNDSADSRVKRREFDTLKEAQLKILLCHAPPKGFKISQAFGKIEAGALRIKALLSEVEPALFVCGHVHEAYGIDTYKNTILLNCGKISNSGRFMLDKNSNRGIKAFLIEFEQNKVTELYEIVFSHDKLKKEKNFEMGLINPTENQGESR